METHKIAKSVHWTASTKFLTQGLSLVSVVVLARLLNASDFGLMSLALVYINFLDTFKDGGFLSAIIQQKNVGEKTLYSCFWILSAFSVVLFCTTWFCSPFIAMFFKNVKLAEILKLLGCSLLLMPFGIIMRGRLSREILIDQIAKAEIISEVARFITSVSMAYMGYGVWSLVFAYLFKNILQSIIMIINVKWYPRLVFSWKEVKPLFSFGMNITGARMLSVVGLTSDKFIVGKLLGAEALGIYTLSHRFSDFVLQFLTTSVYQVVYPVLSRIQDDKNKMLDTFLKFTTYVSSLVIPIMLFMTVAGYDVVHVLIGEKWHSVVFPLQVLSVVAIMRALFSMLPLFFNANGKPWLSFFLTVIYAIVLPASFFTGVKFLGFNGVLYAWGVFPFLYVVILYMAKKTFGVSFKDYIVSVFPGMCCALLMTVCVYGAQRLMQAMSPNIRLPILAVIGGVSYFSFYYLLYKSKMAELAGFLFPKLKPWFA